MIYILYPNKDATIYSSNPNQNTGLDEILETSLQTSSPNEDTPQSSRFLLKFNDSEILDVINNKINTFTTWSANLKCFIANVESINLDTTLEVYPISGSWGMGTGKYNILPEVNNGVSWYWRTYSGSNYWLTSSLGSNVSASFNSLGAAGGGNWYTGSPNLGLFNSNTFPISQSQVLSYSTSKDINMNITNIVKCWVSGAIINEGVIVKLQDEFVNNINYIPKLKYFSIDTNTIYPPVLEFKWRDYVTVLTGSLTSSIISSSQVVVNIAENPGVFYSGSINKFRVNSRPEYPARTFATSSDYIVNYFLPTASYYAIKDLDTNEYIIDFDDIYTQISSDSTGSYFNLNMNGFEPERNYSILIKTTINGSTLIFNDGYYFKVVNG